MARSLETRLARLEAYHRYRRPPHFITSVRVPWDLPDGMDQATWLRDEMVCPCGQRGCPEFRIGFALPER
jgi:hypothetical protein